MPKNTDHDETLVYDGKGEAVDEASLAQKTAPAIRKMVGRFERALKTKEMIKWRFERERGQIDSRSLAKLQASPGFRAPFKEKKVFESSAVAVEVLIDLSGSMRNERIVVAAQTAMALAGAMRRLDIDCEVAGFSSGVCDEYEARERPEAHIGRFAERLVMRRFKSFGKDSLRGLTRIKVDRGAIQNPDGEAVAWAANRLMENPRKRKILIVLSDGRPETSETKKEPLSEDLSSRLEAIRRIGIETIGVGIQSSAVETFYPDRVVVRDLDDLTSAALDALSAILLRGAAKH